MPENLPRALATEINEVEGRYLSAALGEQLDLTVTPHLLTDVEPEILPSVEILIPFIHSHIGAEAMSRMPALQLIATRSTGYEHISLAAATERGVSVANVPGYGEIAVAEHTFALLLALSRKICQAQSRTRQGDFTLEGLRGFDLYGKTLGVVGAGAIGLHVIRIAKGFGMQILASDVQPHSLFAEVIGFRYAPLDELLHVRVPYVSPRRQVDASHERFTFDPNRCILCTRCVRVCDEIEGAHTWDVMGRGIASRVITDLNEPWGDSTTCTSCGKCVNVCPTGALVMKGRAVGESVKRPEFLPYLRRMRGQGE